MPARVNSTGRNTAPPISTVVTDGGGNGNVSDVKTCARCGENKPLSQYYRQGKGYRNPCKSCYKVQCANWPSANSERRRYATLKSTKGITKEQYEARYLEQEGKCLICSDAYPVLNVDHDHNCCSGRSKGCGKCIRALLCRRCNTLLGLAVDDAEILYRAATYVELFHVIRKAELG
jgi:Recombination endonuclease VII